MITRIRPDGGNEFLMNLLQRHHDYKYSNGGGGGTGKKSWGGSGLQNEDRFTTTSMGMLKMEAKF